MNLKTLAEAKVKIRQNMNFVKRLVVSHIDFFYILIILAFGTILFIPNLGNEPLWVGDETVHFQWAEHMKNTGDYLTPWAYGDVCLWISKPPLVMWLMSSSFHIFGINNFATRFWSPIFGILSCILIYYLGKTLFNRNIGVLSAFILSTFTTFYTFSRHAMLDIPLVFFSLASIFFFILSEKSEKDRRFALLSGIFFGFALMTKQLQALIIPLILCLYLIITQKSFRFVLTKRFVLFLGTGFLIFSPWIIYMHLRFGSDFWQSYFFYSVFQRVVEPIEFLGGDYLYYFRYLINEENRFWVALLPFAFSLCGIKVFFQRKKEDFLLLIWILIILGIFTFSQTKLYWYILPVFPAFSIVLASFLSYYFRKLKVFGILPLALLLLLVIASASNHLQELNLSRSATWDLGVEGGITSMSLYEIENLTLPNIVIARYYNNGTCNIGELSVSEYSTPDLQKICINGSFVNKTINSVIFGEFDNQSPKEIVISGISDNGTQNLGFLTVSNSMTLSTINSTEWSWGTDTCVNSMQIGEIDDDGVNEIVTGGHFFDGKRNVAQLIIWNGQTLTVERIQNWYWLGNTSINSISISDVNNDGVVEIITGGFFHDGSHEVSQLIVWNSTLGVESATGIYEGTTARWGYNTRITCLATGDVDGDGSIEVVTGGYYQNDFKNAQIVVWNGKDLHLKKATGWAWNDTCINSIAIGNVDGDEQIEIITGGCFYDGHIENAQLGVFSGSSLSLKAMKSWHEASNTQIYCLVVNEAENNGNSEILAIGTISNKTVAQLTVWNLSKN